MTRRVLRSLVLAALVAACVAAPAHAAGGRAHTHTIAYDRYSFSLDGQRVWLWSAEFHYFRLPNPDLWRDQLEKLKAAGFNTVSLYFSWAYHSPAPGVFDFSGVRDLDRLLDIAQEVGLYVIARPGPYINAELDSGGFPAWLTTQAGRARSNADDYQAAWEQWFSAVNRIIARHQFTDGRGPVILYQIENEYDGRRRRLHGGAQGRRAPRRHHRAPVPQRQGPQPAVVGRSGGAGDLRDRHLSGRLRLQPHVVPGPHRLPLPARRHLVQPAAAGRRQPPVLLRRVPGRRLRSVGRTRLRPLPRAHGAGVRADVLRQQHREPVHRAEPLHDLRRDELGLAGRSERRLHLLRLRRRVQRAAPADREGPGPQAAGLHGRDGARPAEDRRPGRGGELEPGDPRLGQGEPRHGVALLLRAPRRQRDGRDGRHDDVHRLGARRDVHRVGAGQRPRLQDPARRLRPRAPAAGLLDVGDLHAHAGGVVGRGAPARAARGERGDGAALPQPSAREGARRRRRRRVGRRAGRPAPELRARRAGAGVDQRRRAAAPDCCCSPTATRRRRSGGSTARAGRCSCAARTSCAALRGAARRWR